MVVPLFTRINAEWQNEETKWFCQVNLRGYSKPRQGASKLLVTGLDLAARFFTNLNLVFSAQTARKKLPLVGEFRILTAPRKEAIRIPVVVLVVQ
jgi:hypothetical protein